MLMLKVILCAFVCFPVVSVAAQKLTKWEGKGSCYLGHIPSPASPCDYFVVIDQQSEQLSILKCVIWHQQWGDGSECSQKNYDIQNENELWLRDGDKTFKAGAISDAGIHINYIYNATLEDETFGLQPNSLIYSRMIRSVGTEWLYNAQLRPYSPQK